MTIGKKKKRNIDELKSKASPPASVPFQAFGRVKGHDLECFLSINW